MSQQETIVIDPQELRRALGEIKSAGTTGRPAKEAPPACKALAGILERMYKLGNDLLEKGRELIEPLRAAISSTGRVVRKASQMLHLLPGFAKDIRRAHRLDNRKRTVLQNFIGTLIARLPSSGIRLRVA